MQLTWRLKALGAAVLCLTAASFVAADGQDKGRGGFGGFQPGKGGFDKKDYKDFGKDFKDFGKYFKDGKDDRKDGGKDGATSAATVDLTKVSPETAAKIIELVRNDHGAGGRDEKRGGFGPGGFEKKGFPGFDKKGPEKEKEKEKAKTVTIDLNKLPPEVARMLERYAESEKGKEKEKGKEDSKSKGKGKFGKDGE